LAGASLLFAVDVCICQPVLRELLPRDGGQEGKVPVKLFRRPNMFLKLPGRAGPEGEPWDCESSGAMVVDGAGLQILRRRRYRPSSERALAAFDKGTRASVAGIQVLVDNLDKPMAALSPCPCCVPDYRYVLAVASWLEPGLNPDSPRGDQRHAIAFKTACTIGQ